MLSLHAQKVDPESVRVTYKCLNSPLPVVLKELSQLSKVNIIFSESKIKNKSTLTFEAKNEKLVDVLAVILKKYRLQYNIIEDQITIENIKNKELYLDFTISGYLKDKKTGDPLPFASVYLKDQTAGVFTNEQGFYSIKLRRSTYNLVFSYIGYDDDTVRLFLKRDTILNRNLNDNFTTLSEVVIEEDLNKSLLRFGEEYYSKDKINDASSLLGESDVLRALHTSAGVAAGSDGFGGISIRGGNTDQNLILYDGVPMQNTGHAFGLLSIFNSDLIHDARLIKTAIPARYGGRLSSILDIKTRQGNMEKYSGEVGISIITSKVLLEGPIQKNRSSFLFSYRRTFADPWLKLGSQYLNQTNESTGRTNYYFNDLNLKLNFKFDTKNQFSVLFYSGGDRLNTERLSLKPVNNLVFKDQYLNDNLWKNSMLSLHLNSQIGKNKYSKFSTFYSTWSVDTYAFNRNAQDSANVALDIFNTSYKGTLSSVLGLRWDLDHQLNKGIMLRYGGGINSNLFKPGFYATNNLKEDIYPDTFSISDLKEKSAEIRTTSTEVYSYVESEFAFSKKTILNVGLHASRYSSDSVAPISLQPRISLNLTDDRSWFTIAFNMQRQYQQALNEDGLGFPSEMWIMSTAYIKPADALNAAASLGFIMAEGISSNFGLYYKRMKNIVSLGEGEALLIDDVASDRWQKNIPRGTGEAYGLEASINISNKILNGEFNASYGKSTRYFPDINNGKPFLYKLDRRYSANLNLNFRLGARSHITINSTYQEGAKVSFPSGGVFNFIQNGKPVLAAIFNEKNNYKFPDYFRVDLGFQIVTGGKKFRHKIYAGIYNVSNQVNPIYLKIDRNIFKINSYEVNQISLFPVLPALAYTFVF